MAVLELSRGEQERRQPGAQPYTARPVLPRSFRGRPTPRADGRRAAGPPHPRRDAVTGAAAAAILWAPPRMCRARARLAHPAAMLSSQIRGRPPPEGVHERGGVVQAARAVANWPARVMRS